MGHIAMLAPHEQQVETCT